MPTQQWITHGNNHWLRNEALDIPATLERLETLSVAVVGYRTSRFPAFWLSDCASSTVTNESAIAGATRPRSFPAVAFG